MAAIFSVPVVTAQSVSAAQTRAIAKEAYIYGYPMVQAYLTMYAFSIDKNNPQYKGPFNVPLSFARVFTPGDTAFVTPNSGTPYTFLSLDLAKKKSMRVVVLAAVMSATSSARAPFFTAITSRARQEPRWALARTPKKKLSILFMRKIQTVNRSTGAKPITHCISPLVIFLQ
jgi:hypothetical protein